MNVYRKDKRDSESRFRSKPLKLKHRSRSRSRSRSGSKSKEKNSKKDEKKVDDEPFDPTNLDKVSNTCKLSPFCFYQVTIKFNQTLEFLSDKRKSQNVCIVTRNILLNFRVVCDYNMSYSRT